MAMACVRIMSAGKAGLESLPDFVEECIKADISQLEPFAIVHSREAVNQITLLTRDRAKDGGH